MSREELREQLARLADSAPTAAVPEDTYQRGRRATARSRITASVLAAGCLVLASVLGVQLLGQQSRVADVAGQDGEAPVLGVPDRIWAPPHALPAADGFAVGRAAAAYVDTRGQVIVVDAATGAYRRLGVPASPAVNAANAVALAPDGRHLAVVRTLAEPGHPGAYRADIAIIDLDSGAIHYVLPHGGPVNIFGLAWSANSRWLAWQAVSVGSWTEQEYRAGTDFGVGVVRIADGKVRQRPTMDGAADAISVGAATYGDGRPRCLAVSDDGRVAVVAGNTLWLDGHTRRIPLRASDAGWDKVSALWFGRGGLQAAIYYSLGSSAKVGSLTAPTQRSTVGIQVPLFRGVAPDGQVLLQQDGSDHAYEEPTAVAAVPQHAGSGVALDARPVIAVAPDVTQLSLATDLMTPERLTVHRSEPDWPWSTRQKAAAGAGLLLLLGGLVGGGLWWRRRRA